MWFSRVQGEDYRRGREERSHTPVDPKGSADDGKRSEAKWTLYNAGIKGEASRFRHGGGWELNVVFEGPGGGL